MAANPFDRLTSRMDAVTVSRMGREALVNGVPMLAVNSHFLAEMGPLGGDGLSLVIFTSGYRARKGDIVNFEGTEYSVTRYADFNGKPQVWLE